jgi:hypothetical protein
VKINTIESLPFGECDPSLDGRFRFVESFSDFTEACTGSICGDHLTAFDSNIAAVFCVSLKMDRLEKNGKKRFYKTLYLVIRCPTNPTSLVSHEPLDLTFTLIAIMFFLSGKWVEVK